MSKLSDSLKDNAARLKDNAQDLSGKAGERLSAAKESARELAGTAKERGGELIATGREKVSHGVGVTREKVSQGVDVTRDKAHVAAEKGKEAIDSNPLAVVAGGLVLGAIVAALLPTSERERTKLGGAGSKLKDKVKTAASAAKETASSKIEETGLNADALKDQFGGLVGKGLDILKEASKAAGDAAKK